MAPIVAGISAGQSLVRQVGLRQILTDLNTFTSASNSFKLKYDAIAGDMRNAYDYWGVDAGCSDNFVNSDSTGCNGNGDGVLTSMWTGESSRFWQHLSLAEVLEGSYSGESGALPVAGVNSPAILSGCYEAGGPGQNVRAGPPIGYLAFGVPIGTSCTGDIITGAEAHNIENKYGDDGLAFSGSIWSMTAVAGCVTGPGYNLSESTRACSILFYDVW